MRTHHADDGRRTAEALSDFAAFRLARKEDAQAEELYWEAVRARAAVAGSDDSDTAKVQGDTTRSVEDLEAIGLIAIRQNRHMHAGRA